MTKRRKEPPKKEAMRRPGRPRKFKHCPAWRKVIFAEIERAPPVAAASAPYRRRAECIASLWIDANTIDPRFYSPRTPPPMEKQNRKSSGRTSVAARFFVP